MTITYVSSTGPDTGRRGLRRISLALLVVIGAVGLILLVLRQSDRSRHPLSDAQIAAFLRDDADFDGITYALSQIEFRLTQGERIDRWVKELLRLAAHPAQDVRHRVARLMGRDPSREEFHRVLAEMLRYEAIPVRNAAALSLAEFGDSSGREQIISMLQPISIDAPRPGHVEMMTRSGATVGDGEVVLRLQSGAGVTSVSAPVAGRIRSVTVQEGDIVTGGTRVAVVDPGPDQVLAALRGLAKVGQPQDVRVLTELQESAEAPVVVREQAKATEQKIKERVSQPGS